MSLKIFVLEDEIHRYPRNQIVDVLGNHELVLATSAFHGMRLYRGGYDLALLDHDMEGFFEETSHKNTGTSFVRWMVDQHYAMPKQIILHSQNPVGRAAMRALLKDVGYLNVDECPFGPKYVELLRTIV